MKRHNPKLLAFCLMLLCANISFAQMLWPGDVNDNGVVNGIDVLYAGVAYGNTGAIRPSATENWEAQATGTLWSSSFFDGTNHAYADCNGNGIIDEDDIEETIKNNFFLTHGDITPDIYSTGNIGEAPQVKLIPQNVNIGVGGTAVIDLWLGEEVMPVQDFYGIAIRMRYNPDFTLGSEWEFEELPNAWFDPSDDTAEEIDVVDEGAGIIELAITRTNQQSISGAGKVGEFSVVIEDIIFGLQADTLMLEIESVRMIDKDFNTLSAVKDSTFVIISKTNHLTTLADESSVRIFPNPLTDVFTIAAEHNLLAYEISDITGRQIFMSGKLNGSTKTATISAKQIALNPQLYFLKVYTEEGIVVKKLIVN